MGYGAMRLPGEGVWGEPRDADTARKVLRRAIDLGVNFIDTAWYYGPLVANRLIVEALHPYPKDLVIATKLGARRPPDKSWVPAIKPDELREGVETDLRTLKRDRLDVVHLRTMPHAPVPFAESLGALIDMKREGKIRHIAVSNVSRPQLEEALAATEVVAVQNLFHAGHQHAPRGHVQGPDDVEAVLDLCTARGIGFLPFFPLAMGRLGKESGTTSIHDIAKRRGATTAQIALAWLLARSPVMLPIPGTSSVEHLEENWAARDLHLTKDEVAAIG